MSKRIKELCELLGGPKIPRQVTVTENGPFTTKSEVREFLEAVLAEIVVIDN